MVEEMGGAEAGSLESRPPSILNSQPWIQGGNYSYLNFVIMLQSILVP